MRVLVACEFSGRVRDAFRAQGHDALSCDLFPTDAEGPHYQGPVEDILNQGWDLMIAHPPCTYLTNTGSQYLHTDPSRWAKLDKACAFFNLLLDADIHSICVENPVPHKYAVKRLRGRTYTQVIQPWWFGHSMTKATCLWLKNLSPLVATNIVSKKSAEEDWTQYRPVYTPSADRWKLRSLTFLGVAQAMAQQWTQESTVRVFYAHASGDDSKNVDAIKAEIHEAIADRMDDDVLVVPGRDDFQRNWRGDWETWQESVVSRKNAVTSKPVYDLFVVAALTCGRSTANILGVALMMKRPVLFWDGKFSKVEAIKASDPDDWAGGFQVCREPEQVPLFEEETNDHAH